MLIRLPSALAAALLVCAPAVLAQNPSCDAACLTSIAERYLQDVARQDASGLPWADRVRYTENNVAMMIGDGFWGAGPGVSAGGLFLPDAITGNIVWFGITSEHGQAAYHGLRLRVQDAQITEVESYLGREGTPEVFGKVDQYRPEPAFAERPSSAAGLSREQLVALVDGYFNSKQQNNGQVFTAVAADCRQQTNGKSITSGDHWAATVARGCAAQLRAGLFKPVDRIRARRYPVIDETRGIVVALSIEDHATRFVDYVSTDGKPLAVEVEYPNSRGRLDLFKISEGEIVAIEGVSVFLPYYIHSLWQD